MKTTTTFVLGQSQTRSATVITEALHSDEVAAAGHLSPSVTQSDI